MADRMRTDNARVGFVELFFDLVFVFAITQLSHHLLAHFSPAGAAEAVLVFLAVWWVWIYTTWVLNWLNPDAASVRMMLFGLMGAGLFLSMSIPDAFGHRGWVFAASYVAMQVGRTLFMYVSVAGQPQRRRTYQRILIWFLMAAVFWAAGAAAEGGARYWLWVTALGIEYLGPAVAYWLPVLGRDVTTNWRVAGGHIAERCGLFVIICLGETLLVSGATFADMDWDAAGIAAFLGSLLGSVGMWWVYFHIGFLRGSHQIEHSDDPGRIARLSFTYAHIPIVAGIVLSAVGAERAIAHPTDIAQSGDIATLVGGTALFLAGNGWFKWLSAPWFPLSHIVGLGLAAALAATGPFLELWLLAALSSLILVVVAVWEDRSLSRAAGT